MPSWPERQAGFAAALLHPAAATPPELLGPHGTADEERFAVYRTNIRVALVDALRDAYPVVERLVGTPFFEAMALQFAVTAPPTSPVMLDYGSGFATFIEGFAPAAELPYLADVARIERSGIEAYHADEAQPITTAVFVGMRPERFGNMRFELHPSLRVVRSPWPALSIWNANLPGHKPIEIDAGSGGEIALIVRPDSQVAAHAISAGAAALIDAFARGETVEAAAANALACDDQLDLSGCLTALIALGGVLRRIGRSRREAMTMIATARRSASGFIALLAPLALRIALALPFLFSGLTKWSAPGVLAPSAPYLFTEEFRLHLFGSLVPLPAPLFLAHVDAIAEILLPLLLIIGLGTRLSALALLLMTAVIQLVVPDGWQTYHLPWAAMALGLLALGAGPLSIDYVIARRWRSKERIRDR